MSRPAPSEPQERKTFPGFTLSAQQSQGIVEHVVAVMGNTDDGDDIIHPGAFKKTLQQRAARIRVLDQHQSDSVLRILGKPLEMREIGRDELPPALLNEFPDAQGGLWCRTQFLMNTPEGSGAFERVKEGVLNEWSIGFDAIAGGVDYSKQGGKTIRNLRELRLWEYSPVLWGMNTATTTISAKGADVSEDKELDPSGRPVQRLGDVLQGSIHRVFTDLCDGWYVQGYMSRDDRIALSKGIGDALDLLNSSIPDALAGQEVYSYYSTYGMFGADGPGEVKEWDAAYQNALPDSAFAIVEGSGDDKVRKLPHHSKGGAVDLPHLRNALARVNQVSGVSAEAKSAAESHLQKHAKAEGIGESADKAGRAISAQNLRDHVQPMHDHAVSMGASCSEDNMPSKHDAHDPETKAATSEPADPAGPSTNGTSTATGLLGEIDRLLIDTHLLELEAIP